MIEVSKEQFFQAVGPRDVHPRSEPDCSVWEDQRTREVVGRTEPGWRAPTGKPKRYWISDKYAATANDGEAGNG